ncbi:TonB-dependent vitamin B12 receptor [Nitrosomonas sp. Nm34]|uniref:TonB-dependent vitamin B12 receptor n=1 Tax=Nitrosomonas sp. Nm34 TaxID=1881055 RepID=UPI0008F15189|nr:TonB-dependent vitamin B12 receptor [Nitrosomonas sp. Nm34]SFI29114.1 vitamin B12 transporter [Nitrosomonas sp. Nm34]
MQKCRSSAMAVLWLGTATTAATTVLAENIDHPGKPIIVTATRTAQTTEESLASVTVISRKDIERQQARSLEDLFRGVLGINVNNNGGPGKGTFLQMRGTESDHVLVLIDGIKAGSATSGTTAFENIPVEQIERIEIVRGPRSSLYGSEAIGGVIQIFTRKGVGEGIKPSFSFGGGSYTTFNGSIGLSGGGKQGWFNMTVSGIGTSGFNACTGSATAGCFTDQPDPDRDGYRNVAGSARAGYRFQNGLEIEGNFMHSAGKTEFDGSFVNKAVIAQQVFGGSARFSPFDFWRVNIIAGRSRDDADNYLGKVFMTRFDTTRDTITWQNNFMLHQNHQLTVGTDYQHDQVNSTEAFTVNSRGNWGVFAQYLASLAAHNVQLSLRHDDNQQFGSRVTGGAGWGYAITDKVRLIASFGSAFKAPTFNELFFPGFGNANLRPEESRSFEFGVRGSPDWGNWSLNVYQTRIDELIAFDASILAPANIDQARIQGLEAVLGTQIMGWQLNGNLTFLDPENRSSGLNKGNILPRRAEQTFRLDIDRQFGRYRVGAMFLAEGERFDDIANTRKLDSYVKFDLRAEYIMSKHWRLLGRIENLFNEHYETAAFFNQPGRNFFATLRYQP